MSAPMSTVALVRNALRLVAPLALAATIWLYLYPVFLGCAFPAPGPESHSASQSQAAWSDTLRHHLHLPSTGASKGPAPFRLLALGDPQLEGDTSIPHYGENPFPNLASVYKHLSAGKHAYPSDRIRYRHALHDLVDFFLDDIPDALESIRKRIDLFGNDFYLAHIYRTLRWWSRPTHVTVLGDLLGSQWIGDEEFARRSSRFWNRSFKGGERVPDSVATYPADERPVSGLLEVQDDTSDAWIRRVINVAGNHDIGYAGDLTIERLERFERTFGKAAYELRFLLPITNATSNATMFDPSLNPTSDRLPPELRVVVINNMNLDTPAVEQSLQDSSYAFLNDVINTASPVDHKGHFTVTLTHIPLYKAEGICVDAPMFNFHDGGAGVKEQNQLSMDASRGFLEGIYGLNGDSNAPGQGMGRRGVILNGHDHEGCDTYHYINQTEEEREWRVSRWGEAQRDAVPGQLSIPGLREITVRSMMGGFGGNAGLLSAWFDEDTWEWRFEFANCALGTQYVWWAVHVLDLIAIVGLVLYGVLSSRAEPTPVKGARRLPAPKVISATSESKVMPMATIPETEVAHAHGNAKMG